MVVSYKEYHSFGQFLEELRAGESRIREQIMVIRKIMESIRPKAEVEEKIVETLKNVVGGDKFFGDRVIDVNGIKININPSPRRRYLLLDKIQRDLAGKLEKLTTIIRVIESLARTGIAARIQVYYEDGLPKDIIVDF